MNPQAPKPAGTAKETDIEDALESIGVRMA
jgi:hypothetical protein